MTDLDWTRDAFVDPDDIVQRLAGVNYLADEALATAIWLALRLDKPLLVEGVPGVGKTEVAKALAEVLGRRLIRLQCFEGIDSGQALYDWDYGRQLLAVRRQEVTGESTEIYGEDFLVERPLLSALRDSDGVVLLIDEVDRSDEEFEAFLLEFLAEFQVSIPEYGTVTARSTPVVVLTSNRTRELHDALKRRTLYHWIGYPSPVREQQIIAMRAPEVADEASASVVAAVNSVRAEAVIKPPGVAESIDWARGATMLNGLGASWPEALRRSLGLLLKDDGDLAVIDEVLDEFIGVAG